MRETHVAVVWTAIICQKMARPQAVRVSVQNRPIPYPLVCDTVGRPRRTPPEYEYLGNFSRLEIYAPNQRRSVGVCDNGFETGLEKGSVRWRPRRG